MIMVQMTTEFRQYSDALQLGRYLCMLEILLFGAYACLARPVYCTGQ